MKLNINKGKRYGMLVVIKEVAGKRQPKGLKPRTFLCECDCGNSKKVLLLHLRQQRTKSCGCLQAKLAGERTRTHGMTNTVEFHTWQGIKNRCYNTKGRRYNEWGGRGVKVCNRWKNSFENFYADMGKRPTPNHSIDRIDNNGDYILENCRWATRKIQNRNKASNKVLTFKGKTMCLADWADETGIEYYNLENRLNKYGWSIKKTLTTPVCKLKK